MDNTGLEPANAESNASTEAPKVDSEGTEVEGADPATAAAEPGKPARDKVQERFDQLTREKYEGLSRAERAEYRAQLAEQRLADIEARQAAKPEPVAQVEDYPSLESVGYDEDKHRAAVATWSAKQAREAARAEIAAERTAAQRDQLERDWERKQDDFIKSKPDYADKVGKLPPSLMPDALAAAIKETGNPEIAYYLAENLDKLAEIARLPPRSQDREIGRIEARLEAAKAAPPPVSKAPPPVSKIDATTSSGDKDPEQMSDAEFAKWRSKQIAQRR